MALSVLAGLYLYRIVRIGERYLIRKFQAFIEDCAIYEEKQYVESLVNCIEDDETQRKIYHYLDSVQTMDEALKVGARVKEILNKQNEQKEPKV